MKFIRHSDANTSVRFVVEIAFYYKKSSLLSSSSAKKTSLFLSRSLALALSFSYSCSLIARGGLKFNYERMVALATVLKGITEENGKSHARYRRHVCIRET